MLRALTGQLPMLQTHEKWIPVRRPGTEDVESQTVPWTGERQTDQDNLYGV